MSTRATYEFTPAADSYDLPATLYVHHDGYPVGAAAKFYRMLAAANQRGGAATVFLRANDEAELTDGHAGHGDTQWRYTLLGSGPGATLSVMKACSDLSSDDPGWSPYYSGPLREFIDQEAATLPDDTTREQWGFHGFGLANLSGYGADSWVTPAAAKRAADDALHYVGLWSAKGTWRPGAANYDSQISRLRSIAAAFPAMAADNVAWRLAIAHADAVGDAYRRPSSYSDLVDRVEAWAAALTPALRDSPPVVATIAESMATAAAELTGSEAAE